MMPGEKIYPFFEGRSYGDVNELLSDAFQLSDQIREHPFRKSVGYVPKRLTPFHNLVLEVARQLPETASSIEVAREVVKRQSGVETQEPDKLVLNRVASACYILRKLGLLQKFSRKSRRSVSSKSFSWQIKELAPNFRNYKGDGYNVVAITKEVLKRQGRGQDKLSKEEIAIVRKRVKAALFYLKRRGSLSPSQITNLPRLRTATNAQIETHLPLVDQVLRSGHSWIRNWQNYLDENEARNAARKSLIAAIEKHDDTKSKVPFEAFARFCIRRGINRVLKERREGRKLASLDAALLGHERTTLHDRLATPAIDPVAVKPRAKALLALHKQGRLKAQHISLWTLEQFCHSQQQMASFFGTTREAVRLNILKAKKALAQIEK